MVSKCTIINNEGRKPLMYSQECPPTGNTTNHVERAGRFLLGRILPNSTIRSVTNYLAREDGTDHFRILKVLTTLPGKTGENDEMDESIFQGKIAIHTENLLLKCLKGESGVVQQHGLFKDVVTSLKDQVPRVLLVLDCYVQHDFSPAFVHLTNFYEYTRKMRRLEETEATSLFFQAVRILRRVHELNIVHQNLNLRNFILNTKTGEVTLSNFNQGRLLTRTDEFIQNRYIGSLLHQSPENVRGEPFLGKPSDMWAMGVIFFALLFSEYPFHSFDRNEVLKKIQSGVFTFPSHTTVSAKTARILEGLLTTDPNLRLTCERVLDEILSCPIPRDPFVQVVPHIVEFGEDISDRSTGGIGRKYTLTWDKQGARVLSYGEVRNFAQRISAQNKAIQNDTSGSSSSLTP